MIWRDHLPAAEWEVIVMKDQGRKAQSTRAPDQKRKASGMAARVLWFPLTGDRRRRKNGHAVDALASSADEGRGQLRKASGSEQPRCDPMISEWGNPPSGKGWHPRLNL